MYGIINPKIPLGKGKIDDDAVEKEIKDALQKAKKRSKEIDFGKGKVIRGFTSSGELVERLGRLKNLLKIYGKEDIKVGLRGSSLSGTSSKNELDFLSNPSADLDFFIIDTKFINKHNLLKKMDNITNSLKENHLKEIDEKYLEMIKDFSKESQKQLGRKSSVRIISENVLTGKEIIF